MRNGILELGDVVLHRSCADGEIQIKMVVTHIHTVDSFRPNQAYDCRFFNGHSFETMLFYEFELVKDGD